jgi:hypothetical protein
MVAARVEKRITWQELKIEVDLMLENSFKAKIN